MFEKYRLEHYKNSDNKRKKQVISFMNNYNKTFSDFDLSLEEQANKWFCEDDKEVSGEKAMELYYDNLCDELIVVLDGEDVIACRFVEFDENDTYFRERHDNYELGLNMTFALVHENYREEGIWKSMFNYVVENILPEYDVNRVYLATTSENIEMQNAMDSMGFQLGNRIKNERGEGIDGLIYFKDYN